MLGENCDVKTIDYKTLVYRFSRIFKLQKDDTEALDYLGRYRNKIAHLGLEMPMEYYKIISAINGTLKVIIGTIYNNLNYTITTDNPIYDIYDYIENIIEIGKYVEEEVWTAFYSANFIIVNSYIDALIIDFGFQNYLKSNGYEINITKGKCIDSSSFEIDFNNVKEDLSFTIYIKNKPFKNVSIFLDEDGYVYSVLDQKESLVTDHNRSFYCYKTPTYPLDDEFEDCDFWKNDRKDNKCNFYEFSYENLVNSFKRAVEWIMNNNA